MFQFAENKNLAEKQRKTKADRRMGMPVQRRPASGNMPRTPFTDVRVAAPSKTPLQRIKKGQVKSTKPEETVATLSKELEAMIHEEGMDILLEGEVGKGNRTYLEGLLYPKVFSGGEEGFVASDLCRGWKGSEVAKAAQKKRYVEYVTNVQERIRRGLRDLRESIGYWLGEISEGRISFLQSEKTPRVLQIKLTGSDLHDKGLGAAFVTFELYGTDGPFTKEVVIKPENRDIEESLLADSGGAADVPESLAEKFNREQWSIRDERGEEPRELEGQGRINTIKMKASGEYGTLIEKIVGNEIADGAPMNEVSTVKSIIFAAMCGLYDLHHQNVLWNEGGELYFIDADNALKYDVVGNTQRAQKQSGFPEKFENLNDLVELLWVSGDIMEATKEAFVGKHGRVVPLATAYLANLKKRLWRFSKEGRKSFLQNQYGRYLVFGGQCDERGIPREEGHIISEAEQVKEAERAPEIYRMFHGRVGPGLVREVGVDPDTFQRDDEAGLAEADFMSGQLPFYEYWYSEGAVKHNGQEICIGKNVDEVFREKFR